MKRRLGNLERQLLAYAQMRRLGTLRTGDLIGPLGISPKQERELLDRMSRSGLIAQVRRGLYLVPPRLPLGGRWSPGEIPALHELLSDRGGSYQICGPRAFNRYGLDSQVPTIVHAYNNRLSGQKRVGSSSFLLIKVTDDRLGGTDVVEAPGGPPAVYSSRARTLIDAVYDWSRFDGLPRAYAWTRDELAAGRVGPAELVDLTLRFGNLGTIRRMGYLLENLSVSPLLLRKLERAIRRTRSLISWIPVRPKRGAVCHRWGLVINGKL